jgi:hypothetical protein
MMVIITDNSVMERIIQTNHSSSWQFQLKLSLALLFIYLLKLHRHQLAKAIYYRAIITVPVEPSRAYPTQPPGIVSKKLNTAKSSLWNLLNWVRGMWLEDDLIFCWNGRRPQFCSNGRLPHFFLNGRKHQIYFLMEDDLNLFSIQKYLVF